MHTCVDAYRHTCMDPYMHACMRALIHTERQTDRRTDRERDEHTYIFSLILKMVSAFPTYCFLHNVDFITCVTYPLVSFFSLLAFES